MSGTTAELQPQETNDTTQRTPDVTATPDATIPDVSAPGGGASHADMLTQSEFTRRVVIITSMLVVGISVLCIVITLCHRAWIDGNAPLTNDITTKLMWIALGGLASMSAALYGANSQLAKLAEKIAAIGGL